MSFYIYQKSLIAGGTESGIKNATRHALFVSTVPAPFEHAKDIRIFLRLMISRLLLVMARGGLKKD